MTRETPVVDYIPLAHKRWLIITIGKGSDQQ